MTDSNPMFNEDFPEVRLYIREALTHAEFTKPHTKRELGTAAVCALLSEYQDDTTLRPLLESLAVRGGIAIAAEELRRVRVRFRHYPSISAFYAIVQRDAAGKRRYLQAAVGGMKRRDIERVWRRMLKQGEQGLRVGTVFRAFWELSTWDGDDMTLSEAADKAGTPIEVYAEEADGS